jgi:hypothetical protein
MQFQGNYFDAYPSLKPTRDASGVLGGASVHKAAGATVPSAA